MADFIALLTVLLPLFAQCNKARVDRARGPHGRLARRLALRLAAARTGQTWDQVLQLDEAQAFLEDGFDDEDVANAQLLLTTADQAEAENWICGTPD